MYMVRPVIQANMARYILFIPLSLVFLFLASCSKDKIPEPYQPVDMPSISRIDFICDRDSSVYFFNENMVLTSGRGNTAGNNAWKESFTLEYSGELLTGAAYEYIESSGRIQERKAVFSRNDRNMLSKVACENTGIPQTTLAYDDRYRLTQISFQIDDSYAALYTVTYDDNSNVSSVEEYKRVPVDSYIKWEYGNYETGEKINPFRFLVNVFHAPVFSSQYGALFHSKIFSSNNFHLLGLILSKNNPGTAVKSVKEADEYKLENVSRSYIYEYDDDGYPLAVFSADAMLFVINYFRD
jgi:major membrane immunogen (membrane-anchored lipoprotein)